MTIAEVTAVGAWQQWREERAASLSVPFGWLSLRGLIWLSDEPSAYPGLPGKWWGAQERISVALEASDNIAVGDSAADGQIPSLQGFSGTHTVSAAEGGSTIGAVLEDGTRVEFLTRTGRQVLRLRATQLNELADNGLVPAFEYNEQWLKAASVTWDSEPTHAVVGAAQPGLSHNVKVVGTLAFEHVGQTHELRVTGERGGAVSVLFEDLAQGTAPWRIISVNATGAQDVENIQIDFNLAHNLPFAFSDFGTCPAPLPGNVLNVAVEAGEKAPR